MNGTLILGHHKRRRFAQLHKAEQDADQRLYVRSMASLQAHAIAGSDINGGVVNVVFSPDGQSVAFFSPVERALKRLAPGGGVAVTICPAPDPLYGISWDTNSVADDPRQERSGPRNVLNPPHSNPQS